MGCRTCEKPKMNYRKGLWSPEEDQRLRDYILNHGLSCWSAVPAKAGLQRNGKSCRLRWINYLRPGLKRGIFSQEEEQIVMSLQAQLGNKWSQIAAHLPGRTDNEVKNYWNSYLKKRVAKAEGSAGSSSTISSADSTGHNRNPRDEESNKITPPLSTEPLEVSNLDSGQTITTSSNQCSSSKGAADALLPKVLFSDWLAFDQENNLSLPSLNDGSNCINWGSRSTCLYANEGLQMDQQFSSEYEHEAAVQIPGGGFFDLLFMGGGYGSFNTNYDACF
ncbi:transcription factor MYB6-like [Ananas comosus]|uniref:Transcription factor MYB6-like n=1 Tax=Ananas comosus TaxID=4615 RepID=A0A6P5EA45_ANACO|nr:transcription factor MYB6-like [Ananas comosus]